MDEQNNNLEEPASLNIYQRMNKVREAVGYLKKDAKVVGYTAITHDYVTSEIRPHLIEHGVMIVPRLKSYELKETGKKTKSGVPFTNYVCVYDFDFVNIDNTIDTFTVTVGAMSEDTADKGPGGAISYAMKYAFLKLLNIETGDAEESRQEQKPDLITEDQAIQITDLISEVAADGVKFLKYFKVKTVQDLASDKYNSAIKMLEAKRGKD